MTTTARSILLVLVLAMTGAADLGAADLASDLHLLRLAPLQPAAWGVTRRNGKPLKANTSLARLLAGTAGKTVKVTYRPRSAAGLAHAQSFYGVPVGQGLIEGISDNGVASGSMLTKTKLSSFSTRTGVRQISERTKPSVRFEPGAPIS